MKKDNLVLAIILGLLIGMTIRFVIWLLNIEIAWPPPSVPRTPLIMFTLRILLMMGGIIVFGEFIMGLIKTKGRLL